MNCKKCIHKKVCKSYFTNITLSLIGQKKLPRMDYKNCPNYEENSNTYKDIINYLIEERPICPNCKKEVNFSKLEPVMYVGKFNEPYYECPHCKKVVNQVFEVN